MNNLEKIISRAEAYKEFLQPNIDRFKLPKNSTEMWLADSVIKLATALDKYKKEEVWVSVPTCYGEQLRHSKVLVAKNVMEEVAKGDCGE